MEDEFEPKNFNFEMVDSGGRRALTNEDIHNACEKIKAANWHSKRSLCPVIDMVLVKSMTEDQAWKLLDNIWHLDDTMFFNSVFYLPKESNLKTTLQEGINKMFANKDVAANVLNMLKNTKHVKGQQTLVLCSKDDITAEALTASIDFIRTHAKASPFDFNDFDKPIENKVFDRNESWYPRIAEFTFYCTNFGSVRVNVDLRNCEDISDHARACLKDWLEHKLYEIRNDPRMFFTGYEVKRVCGS